MKFPEYIKPLSDEEIQELEDKYLSSQDSDLIENLPEFSDEEIEILDDELLNEAPSEEFSIEQAPIDEELIDLAFDSINFEKIIKEGYPNIDVYRSVPGQHNVEKWMDVVKQIFAAEKNGTDKNSIFKNLTKDWNSVEKIDFSNWLKFYQQKNHLKYKQAQSYYMIDDRPGYFLPNPLNKESEQQSSVSLDYNLAKSDVDKQEKINKIKSKILSRLDSAEKLIRSEDGKDFAGNEFQVLLKSIYDLKTNIQTLKKASLSTNTYQDLIIRQANICDSKGFIKSASFLNKLADDVAKPESKPAEKAPPTSSPSPTTTPDSPPSSTAPETPEAPASPDPPMQGSGNVGGLPSTGPGNLPPGNNPPDLSSSGPPESDSKKTKGVQGFIAAMQGAGFTPAGDKNKLNDDISSLALNELNSLISLAQAATENISQPVPEAIPQPVTEAAPPAIKQETYLPENKTLSPKEEKQDKNIDLMLDSVFKNITVNDIIEKLESLSKVFKTREIPRQLAIVDMMLDHLGLAALFPTLSEATNKALDSNNYISTRLDEILAKLHGVVKTEKLNLTPTSSITPQSEGIKKKLEEESEKEKARKQMKRDLENQSLESQLKETPEIDMAEELAQPEITSVSPTPPSPAPPAPVPPPTPKL